MTRPHDDVWEKNSFKIVSALSLGQLKIDKSTKQIDSFLHATRHSRVRKNRLSFTFRVRPSCRILYWGANKAREKY